MNDYGENFNPAIAKQDQEIKRRKIKAKQSFLKAKKRRK